MLQEGKLPTLGLEPKLYVVFPKYVMYSLFMLMIVY
jgi:hypothetical protein